MYSAKNGKKLNVFVMNTHKYRTLNATIVVKLVFFCNSPYCEIDPQEYWGIYLPIFRVTEKLVYQKLFNLMYSNVPAGLKKLRWTTWELPANFNADLQYILLKKILFLYCNFISYLGYHIPNGLYTSHFGDWSQPINCVWKNFSYHFILTFRL